MTREKTDKRQERLREILQEKKRALWNELRAELFRNTGEGLHSQLEIPLDPAEQGLIDLLVDTGLTVADIRRQELTAMDEAVGRMEQGRYGICEACGREIPEERLRVMPFARYCREDQERQEGPAYPPSAKL
ncbi:MAG TPA: TraR/DksA C4-type zinc finger protein [Geobacteraceae bacterium]|nr:TraR/DksA C4-type zinc finger protein [Geobacteraceae bacterium]